MFPIRDANPRHGPAIVMWGLLGLNIAVFLYQLSLTSERQLLLFLASYGFIPQQFFTAPVPEAPTLLTSMFLHGGLAHIAGNLFFLFVFGDNVEDRMGPGGFLLFYLLGGGVATLIHGLSVASSPVPMIGASGAISAVLGAYIVLFPRQRVLTFVPPLLIPWLVLALLFRVPRFFMLWLPAWAYIGYWALIQFLEAYNGLVIGAELVDGVAWWAHVGGFLFGVVTVRLFARRPSPPLAP